MKKYIITDIGDSSYIDMVERFGLGIKTIDTNINLNVYCLDGYEYIEGEKVRKNGDIIEGDLHIEYAHFEEKTNLELMHKWIGLEHFNLCPDMQLIIKVTRILHDYKICGITDFMEDELLIDFASSTNKVNTNRKYFKEGDKILCKAKLCLDLWGHIENVKKIYGID